MQERDSLESLTQYHVEYDLIEIKVAGIMFHRACVSLPSRHLTNQMDFFSCRVWTMWVVPNSPVVEC